MYVIPSKVVQIGAFIHSFSQYLWNLYFVPRPVLGTGSPKLKEAFLDALKSGAERLIRSFSGLCGAILTVSPEA